MNRFIINWVNIDGTRSLFYPLKNDKEICCKEQAERIVEDAKVRLNVSNNFEIVEQALWDK
jgi:hypothetical protein